MSKPIMELTKKYQRDPQVVKVNHQTMTVTNIEQSYYEVRGPQKKDVLSRLLDMFNLKSTIVFANTKRMVDEIVSDLQAKGYFAEGLHGDMGQQQRQNTLDKFRKSTIEVLVATDVAARGIDVDNVEAVVQLRPARRRRILRAPHRPHGPRRQVGQGVHVRERPRHL